VIDLYCEVPANSGVYNPDTFKERHEGEFLGDLGIETLEGDSVEDAGRLGWRISWRGSRRRGWDSKES
jgi:hypothetical protein